MAENSRDEEPEAVPQRRQSMALYKNA